LNAFNAIDFIGKPKTQDKKAIYKNLWKGKIFAAKLYFYTLPGFMVD